MKMQMVIFVALAVLFGCAATGEDACESYCGIVSECEERDDSSCASKCIDDLNGTEACDTAGAALVDCIDGFGCSDLGGVVFEEGECSSEWDAFRAQCN